MNANDSRSAMQNNYCPKGGGSHCLHQTKETIQQPQHGPFDPDAIGAIQVSIRICCFCGVKI